MPLYNYECPEGHTTEELRPTPLRNGPCRCSECGNPARLKIGTSMVRFGIPGVKGHYAKSTLDLAKKIGR